MFTNSTSNASNNSTKGSIGKIASENSSDTKNGTQSEENSKVDRLRQKTIIISLILVIATAFMVFLVSRAIDRHLDAVSSTTELRHSGDHLLLNLVSQTEAERAYYLTRNPDYEKQFKEISALIDDNLTELEEITRRNPAWHA